MIPLERRLCRYGAGAGIPGCIGGFIDNGKGNNSINDLEKDIDESQAPDGDKARERIANRMKRVEQIEDTLGKRRRYVPPLVYAKQVYNFIEAGLLFSPLDRLSHRTLQASMLM